MEIIFLSATISLILFMLLATYDGAYLHLWKYQLFLQKESQFEHVTHTMRAALFPIIVWLLFLNHDAFSLTIGIAFVVIDLIILGVDAYSERDSRAFMGGLPRSEYLMHLFANGFHFASIFLVLSTKFTLNSRSISFAETIPECQAGDLFHIVSVNVIPGAILLAVLHFLLMLPKVQDYWVLARAKVTCC